MFPTLTIRRKFHAQSIEERRCLNAVEGIIGRTEWDRAHAWAMAPRTPYHHVDEMMRPDYFDAIWSPQTCDPWTLYSTARLSLAKGVHTLLEALVLVRREFPQIRLRLGAQRIPNAETRYLEAMIRRYGLSGSVDLLGWIDSRQMVSELLRARLFVYPSFIENGCNAVQEAMLMGLPIVCTAAGGMTTTLSHGETGVLVRPGDANVMAWNIVELLRDSSKSVRLGNAARQRARLRHDPAAILRDLARAYEATLGPRGVVPA